MYTLSNLLIFSEYNNPTFSQIKKHLIDKDIIFKELHSLKLSLSSIKNPQNYIVLLINNNETLRHIESAIKNYFDFQNRVFVVFENEDLDDHFFFYNCTLNSVDKLDNFIQSNILNKNNLYANKTQTLLYELIRLELIKLDLSEKYVGFEYLVEGLTRALSSNYYSNNHVDMFCGVPETHATTIDTVERNIRHMLSTAWKNNETFKTKLNLTKSNKKPNLKFFLDAIITHIKQVI